MANSNCSPGSKKVAPALIDNTRTPACCRAGPAAIAAYPPSLFPATDTTESITVQPVPSLMDHP